MAEAPSDFPGGPMSADWLAGLPVTMNELILHVQWLTSRVQALESEVYRLSTTPSLANLRSVEYKIQRLYVRDLSGTLNIGITSIGKDMQMANLEQLNAMNECDAQPGDEDGPSLAPDGEDMMDMDDDG